MSDNDDNHEREYDGRFPYHDIPGTSSQRDPDAFEEGGYPLFEESNPWGKTHIPQADSPLYRRTVKEGSGTFTLILAVGFFISISCAATISYITESSSH